VSRVYWQRYNQEEGEGPFFHNDNACTLNRILGLLTRDFLTFNFFQKLVAASLQGEGLRDDRLLVPFLTLKANGTALSDVGLAVICECLVRVLSLSAKA